MACAGPQSRGVSCLSEVTEGAPTGVLSSMRSLVLTGRHYAWLCKITQLPRRFGFERCWMKRHNIGGDLLRKDHQNNDGNRYKKEDEYAHNCSDELTNIVFLDLFLHRYQSDTHISRYSCFDRDPRGRVRGGGISPRGAY